MLLAGRIQTQRLGIKTIDAKSSSLLKINVMAASVSLAALFSLLQLQIASVLVQSYLLSRVATQHSMDKFFYALF